MSSISSYVIHVFITDTILCYVFYSLFSLHNQIIDIGGAKLSAVQSRLKVITNDIDKVTGQITKNSVGVKTSER